MSDDRPLSADRVPTLTEVVELALPPVPAADADAAADTSVPVREDGLGDVTGAMDATAVSLSEVAAAERAAEEQAGEKRTADEGAVEAEPPAESSLPIEPAPPARLDQLPALAVQPPVDVDALVGHVLSELTPRIDMLLESRLRDALAPALARAADGLIRDTRVGLAAVMRDLAREAVDRALQRRDER